MTGALDVSVIVPVYNVMPYLTECLNSLAEQSIGPARMEIIAVDDGSTDGSGKELERFAQLHEGLFTILRQANSGGPAGPCNRGLGVATGRYVFFLGADDHLWREALDRMVAEADEYGSDVVAGKMVGVNDRYVHQALFTHTDHDVQLYASNLPWSMSNAKLFRRQLIEQHGVRFPEDLPVGSDQAFTLEACIHAQRISVLADDSYYFAVKRTDGGNVTYRTKPDVSLACATALMHHAAKLIEAGPHRDAILHRHFAWELSKVLTVSFLELDEETQQDLCRGVAELADAYLTDAIFETLAVRRRLPLSLAQAGRLDILRDVVREVTEDTAPSLLVEGDRAYLRHAGFRDKSSVPDRCYEILGESVSPLVNDTLEVLSLGWSGRPGNPELAVAVRVRVIGLGAPDAAPLRVRALPTGRPAEPTAAPSSAPGSAADPGAPPDVEPTEDGLGTVVRARVALGPLLTPGPSRWTIALCLEVAGRAYQPSLPAGTPLPRQTRWRRGRPVRLSSTATKNGRLQLVVEPVRLRAALGRRIRSLVAILKRK
jgi:hypothetical protein